MTMLWGRVVRTIPNRTARSGMGHNGALSTVRGIRSTRSKVLHDVWLSIRRRGESEYHD